MKALILAGLLATAATAAHAEGDANRADLRCLLGMSVMAKNPTYKEWAGFGFFYFSGRIEGRDPSLNLGEALKREVRQMRPAEYADEIKRCSDQLGERSRGLEALKSTMTPRGVG